MSALSQVSRFRTRSEASIVAGLLDAHGLRASLDTNHHSDIDWLLVPGLGGVGVFVPANEHATAIEIVKAAREDAGTIEEPLRTGPLHDVKLILLADVLCTFVIPTLLAWLMYFLIGMIGFETVGDWAIQLGMDGYNSLNDPRAPTLDFFLFMTLMAILLLIPLSDDWKTPRNHEANEFEKDMS